MKQGRIIVHCLVGNDERFIWYALNSVLPFVDKIMVWDTRSTDMTMTIIRTIQSDKIELTEKGEVSAKGHTKMRDQMLKETNKSKYDWLLILDGDEIWPERMFNQMVEEAAKNNPTAVVVKTVNFVGDIYHRTPESAGHYRFGEKIGHYNLRLISLKTPDLHVAGPHGQQAYMSDATSLQNLPPDKLLILDNVSYFHATHLERSSYDQKTLKRAFKRKYEWGETINRTDLPEIFFQKERPILVPDVTGKASLSFWLAAALQTIPKRLKRFLIPPKSGY